LLDLESCAISGLELRDCTVGEVILGGVAENRSLVLRGCLIGKVCGVATKEGLPEDIFQEGCEIDQFDNMATNNAVVKSDLGAEMKALITILRKLYMQSELAESSKRSSEVCHRVR